MRRRITGKLFAAMIICVTFMTGCNKGVTLNAEQNGIIANYAAHLMVKATYVDYSYEPEIVDAPYGQGTGQGEVETDEEGNVIEPVHDYSPLSEYIGMENVGIAYNRCVVSDVYPEDDTALFVLNAENDMKLVVVEYNIVNTGDSELNYSTPDELPVFRLVVDAETKVRSFKNILLNDISNLSSFTLQPGEEKTVIIVFQVAQDKADALSEIEVQYGEDRHFISLPVELR